MKPKLEGSEMYSKPNSLLIWQEPPHAPEGKSTKLVDLDLYRHSLKPKSEATVQSWDLPVEGSVMPVKLLMVSSGFSFLSLGGNNIQSMAA
jgi:hypothetical protein